MHAQLLKHVFVLPTEQVVEVVAPLQERAAVQHRRMEVGHQEAEHQEENVWMTTRD